MTYDQALTHYGTATRIAAVLRRSKASVSLYKKDGGFPYEIQCVIEKDSKGVLVADRNHDPRSKSEAA